MGLALGVGSAVLIGRAELKDVVQLWGPAQQFVLPAGHIAPNLSELLRSAPMRNVISELNRPCDVVLFDLPPLPATDAAGLAKNVRAPVSRRVLTLLPTRGPDAYGYGSYEYGYGCRYGSDLEAEKAAHSKTGPRRAEVKA